MERGIKQGDVIQITDKTDAWFPSLLVVQDVKAWGVLAYIHIPTSNVPSPGGAPIAFKRLEYGKFEVIGLVIVLAGDLMDN